LVAFVDDGEQGAKDVRVALREGLLQDAHTLRKRFGLPRPAQGNAAGLPEHDVRVRFVEHELKVAESFVQPGKEATNDRVVRQTRATGR
jgi:hypothetical protein